MPEQEIDQFAYEALRALALTHNYNKWIYQLLEPHLGPTVLEVGCGIGNLSRYFTKASKRFLAIDTSASFLEHLRIDCPEMELHHLDISDARVLSLADRAITTIVCVNVLEHVENEKMAIANMFDLLQPGGALLLYVPALNCIYGTLDKNVNHLRRYQKRDLKARLEEAGFQIERMFYSNFLGIFGWAVNGILFKRKRFPIVQPLLFEKLVPLLSWLERLIQPPVGLSLVAVARKPGLPVDRQ